MKNLTITLDEKTVAWLRVYAAERGMSVSRFVGEVLRDRMRMARRYNEAFRTFMAHAPFPFEFPEGRRPSREDLNDRNGLR